MLTGKLNFPLLAGLILAAVAAPAQEQPEGALEEIIVTAQTRDLLGDAFKLEERKPVKVKGKEKPLVIFNVKGFN